MDFRQLEYFTEVARFKSFTRAADYLHVTQPTLSKMVRSLEEELDIALFDRSKRQIVLTDAGETLLLEGEKILRQLSDLPSHLYDVMHLTKGTIRIGLPPLIGSLFFPRLLHQFSEQYPMVTIDIVEAGGHALEKAIVAGDVDLIATVFPADENLTVYPFMEEELHLFLPEHHPLASRASIALEEVSQMPFVLFNETFSLHNVVLNACRTAGFEPTVTHVSSQWDFLCLLVAEENAVTLLPRSLANRIQVNGVKTVPLETRVPWQLGVAVPTGRYQSYVTREWIRFVQDSYSQKE
ncbi:MULTISPECIES: LysR family transcriptional regulator [unclassified Exiguobacterium]|uniref:LysR family transcriptional regulator n=1 Tax=unclassified Exiguobacterium TaxID=2644629 RepID=UPI001BE8438A|nr:MULTISPECIES: LysR family transcriptional regulator [unclassified Exiguobacterium]